MFFPFEVADPHSGLHYRLNSARLAELSLAPRQLEWNPAQAILATPDPVWADSLHNAQAETVSAVATALQDLILSTVDLRPPTIGALPDSRSQRHLEALVNLWCLLGEALPEGLDVVRHVLALPSGKFLDPLQVVEGSLDPLAPAAMRALFERLRDEFGDVPFTNVNSAAPDGSRLRSLQNGLSQPKMDTAPYDDSLTFWGLRDAAVCADFAAARARALIEAGCSAREIAVMTAADSRQIQRAFAEQGVPLSGLPASLPERDIIGETLLHLLLAKRTPTPAMVLASLSLSPLMPWETKTGCDLAEEVIGGEFRARLLEVNPAHKALWQDIRASASSLPQLRFLLDRICEQLPDGAALRARLIPVQVLLAGDRSPDWEMILRAVQIGPITVDDPDRNLEGVSLWKASESPWRPCRHLIVTDFSEGLYPAKPRANPLFLDSEITRVLKATGLQLRGRAEGLARSLQMFEEQLRATCESVTFLIPWRDLTGGRLSPSAGLSLVARAISGVEAASDLIVDLSRRSPDNWPVAHHVSLPNPARLPVPEVLRFSQSDLLALRSDSEGQVLPQSPSRLETLIVSPLAWLLGEIGADDKSWSAEVLDVKSKGNIAHDVFEHVFLPDQLVPDEKSLSVSVPEAYEAALSRHAAFLRHPSWEMERHGLEREIMQAALRWRDHLRDLGACIIGNELWLQGKAHGISLRGKVDAILELPDGGLIIVDHKKSGTSARRKRMEAGWDLQAGLYRDMIANPLRREGDSMDALIGRTVGVAYHLMNDGGLLTSGCKLPSGTSARDLGEEVNINAVGQMLERLDQLKAGRIMLNTTEDVVFFRTQGGFTPYALTDGSPLVSAFTREVE